MCNDPWIINFSEHTTSKREGEIIPVIACILKVWAAFGQNIKYMTLLWERKINPGIDHCLFPLQSVLATLRTMYALICLEEDAAFLRYGYLSADNIAAVRKEVSRLCRELRPHALALVSSFGIPDAFLSPIAFNWIESNSWSSVQQH